MPFIDRALTNDIRSQQWADANRACLETLTQDAELFLAAADRFRALSASTKNSVLKESVAQTSLLLDARTARELIALVCEMGHPGIEKKIAYGCVFYDLIAQTQAQLWGLAEIRSRHLSDMLTQTTTQRAESAKNAPHAGADLARSYAALAYLSLATLKQSGRQWAGFVEDSVAELTLASVQLSRSAKQGLAGVLRDAH